MGSSALVSLLAALVLAPTAPPPPPAPAPFVPVPPGSHPQLSFYQFYRGPTGVEEVAGIDPENGEATRLAGGDPGQPNTLGPLTSTRLSWSADGSRVAFEAFRGAHEPEVYVVEPDTGKRYLVRHTRAQDRIEGKAVISPDGRSVAFLRVVPIKPGHPAEGAHAAIFSVDVESGTLRRVTPWSTKTLLSPTAFTADGRSLAVTLSRGELPAVGEVALGSGKLTVWATNAEEPALGPNGEMVAVRNIYSPHPAPVRPKLRASEILVIRGPDQPTSILRLRGGIASPTWDPSGARIAYWTRLGKDEVDRFLLEGNSLEEVNADGSCRRVVLEARANGSVSGTSWRPGPGREAGSIAC